MLRIPLACLLFLLLATPLFTSDNITLAQDEQRKFKVTGQTVRGEFLKFWEANGEIERQGYPLTGEMEEISPIDGKSYVVQYFERAVFEYHPENPAPNHVLLSLLGTLLYKQKYPNGASNQQPNTTDGSVHFEETGKRLGGKFLPYWQKNGSLTQFGYPISDEFQEYSDASGKTYTVQYFQRAVFELHPENPPPYDVLLSPLGSYRLAQTKNGRFPATGLTIQEPFRTFWNAHEGPTLIGDPVSPELDERSEIDGRTYKTQYFVYGALEYHPELAPPNDILLAHLGTLRYRQKYRQEEPVQRPNFSTGSQYFHETGKRLGGVSLDNWLKTGGRERNGTPISDEFLEKSDFDGKVHLVQYFENTVFELPAEREAPDGVQLLRLGEERYEALHPAKADVWTIPRFLLFVPIVYVCIFVCLLWRDKIMI